MKNKQNSGFTLIELLVVIAIIALLSSVILASITSARDKAKVARAVSNIHQIENALQFVYDTYGCWPGENSMGTCVAKTATNTPQISQFIQYNDFGLKNYLNTVPDWPFDNAHSWAYDNDGDSAPTNCAAYNTGGVNIFPAGAMIPFDTYSKIEQAIDGTPIASADTPAAKYCGKIKFNGDAVTPGSFIVTISYTQ